MKPFIKPAIIGFVFGAAILPFVVALGLVIPYVEFLKPLLIVGRLASDPFIIQISQDSYRMPPTGMLVYFGANGLVYAAVFAVLQYVRKFT